MLMLHMSKSIDCDATANLAAWWCLGLSPYSLIMHQSVHIYIFYHNLNSISSIILHGPFIISVTVPSIIPNFLIHKMEKSRSQFSQASTAILEATLFLPRPYFFPLPLIPVPSPSPWPSAFPHHQLHPPLKLRHRTHIPYIGMRISSTWVHAAPDRMAISQGKSLFRILLVHGESEVVWLQRA